MNLKTKYHIFMWSILLTGILGIGLFALAVDAILTRLGY